MTCYYTFNSKQYVQLKRLFIEMAVMLKISVSLSAEWGEKRFLSKEALRASVHG